MDNYGPQLFYCPVGHVANESFDSRIVQKKDTPGGDV